MANPTALSAASQQPSHSKLVRTIGIVFLALIVLVGVVVLIIWLAVRPRRVRYTIEDGSIHGYNLSNNHLNATFNFVLRAYNPNKKVSIYYNRMEASVSYHDETVAFNTIADSFFQPHRNVTHLGVKLVAQDVTLYEAVAKDLILEKSSGGVEFDIRVTAKIRIKVGAWKSGHRTLKLFCSPAVVHFASWKSFQRTYCDIIDL